jgi:hypothetical protein
MKLPKSLDRLATDRDPALMNAEQRAFWDARQNFCHVYLWKDE